MKGNNVHEKVTCREKGPKGYTGMFRMLLRWKYTSNRLPIRRIRHEDIILLPDPNLELHKLVLETCEYELLLNWLTSYMRPAKQSSIV